MHFQLHHLIYIKIPNFQKIHNVWQLFSRFTASRNRVFWSGAIRWPHYYRYRGSCEHPGTGRCPLRKAEAAQASYCRTVPLLRLHVFDFLFSRRAVPKWRPACIPTTTYVVHFFQANCNFEMHLYDVEKMSDKLVKPPATKTRPAAVRFATQA
jgi:hypothetical protein